MTVIGIAGCSALLVTGFGIRDSISSIVNNQYEKIFKYSGTISYKTDIEKNSDNKIEKILKADDRITDIENIKNKSFKVINKDIEKSANIIVPEDSKKLSEFISFNNRKTGKMYTISDNGVLINEKIGKLLDLRQYTSHFDVEKYLIDNGLTIKPRCPKKARLYG